MLSSLNRNRPLFPMDNQRGSEMSTKPFSARECTKEVRKAIDRALNGIEDSEAVAILEEVKGHCEWMLKNLFQAAREIPNRKA